MDRAHRKSFSAERLIVPGIAEWFGERNKLNAYTVLNNSNSDNIVPLNSESTPFYIASETACEYMSKIIPNVRLVLILREPVSRAYSEYNMKKRYDY